MSLPEIKEATILAVLSKASQSTNPMEYCESMMRKHPQSAITIATMASSLSDAMVGEDADIEAKLTASVVISAAMFLTYESLEAEIEGKQLEDLFDA